MFLLVSSYPIALEQTDSKIKDVSTLARSTAMAICTNMSPFAVKSLLPAIFSQLPVEKKWTVRVTALECIAVFSKTAPKQLGNALPEIVPWPDPTQ